MAWDTARKAAQGTLKEEIEKEYQKKAALLQKQNAAYNDFCEQTGQKKRSERIQIAKWNRREAAKARAAAKRYHEDNE
jgi:hypothetical protein